MNGATDKFKSRRFSFASWLSDRFPGACWVRLFDWSQRNGDDSLLDAISADSACLRDRAANRGACWCGKNRGIA